MANQEHLDIIKQGVEAWNEWREQHGIRPDLSEADLSGTNLSGAVLWEADLQGTDLLGANLSEADLRGADLRGANLGGANLSGANLVFTNLDGADLRGANLTGVVAANLRGAILQKADLQDGSKHE